MEAAKLPESHFFSFLLESSKKLAEFDRLFCDLDRKLGRIGHTKNEVTMNKPSQPIKVVFFDIDETLYVKNKAYIPETVINEVIPQLKAKGIIPAIATGRAFGAFPKALQPLLNKDGFELFVTINGQKNFYRDELISAYPLDQAQIEHCIALCRAHNVNYAFVSAEDIAVSEESPEIVISLKPIKDDYVIDPDYYRSNTIYQMLAFYPESNNALEQDAIFADELKVVRWHEVGVDILRQENSKARGIRDVLKHFGFGLENAMAFGDGLNDIEMLETVGFGVAMGNAEAVLKEKAKFVTKSIEEDGILYALKTLEII